MSVEYYQREAFAALDEDGDGVITVEDFRRMAQKVTTACGTSASSSQGKALFDFMNRVPVVGSSRIPVRYHLWVSLAVAALAGVGVDRLSRPGRVRLGWSAAAT